MNIDENRDLIKNYTEQIWNQGNLDRLGEFMADNYVEHTPFGTFEGLDELRAFITMNRRSFPDFDVSVNVMVAEEDSVANNYTVKATHEERFAAIEATGNRVVVDGCYIGRVENGKLVEGWNQFDMMAMLTQLDVLSPDEIFGDMEELGGMGRPETRH